MQRSESDTTAEALTDETRTDEALIRAAIEDLRPTLLRDGGDIMLHKIQGDLVVVEMTGACVGCVLASVTVSGVRKVISEKVGRPIKVIPRSAFVPVRRMHPATRRAIQITEAKPGADVPA